MLENVGHIISKIRWDTSLDKKERASAFQERLSSWSRLVMPKEIAEVFDKVCPPEQTWRIQFLEIDLGRIDFNNLEAELAERLPRQLHEKLTDLIRYANRGDRHIEILDENASHVYLIGSFLLQGLMPWNYRPEYGSVNQMLANQLKTNRHKVIAMVREVGATHAHARKRMSWQIQEPNIIKIIEGLEPHHHTQIVDFSNELVKIQIKETVVQSGIADFKKNVWRWVFNYLLTERGTVFNKVAFMKSSIRQLAAHHNTSYDALLGIISRAANEVRKRYQVNAGFMLILQTLAKESGSLKNDNERAKENTPDYWDVLKGYFLDPASRRSTSGKPEFNSLVLGLSGNDARRFRELLLSPGNSDNLWQALLDDLDTLALEAVCSALEAGKPAVAGHIRFLDKLYRQLHPETEPKVLWGIGLKYLLASKHAAWDNKAFLNYCMACLSKTNQMPKEEMLDRLTSATVPSSGRTIAALEIYTTLSAVFITELSRKDSTFLAGRFLELINALSKQLSNGTIHKDLFVPLQQTLVKNMRLHPQAALRALAGHPDKESLQRLLPYLLDDHLTHLLLKHADKEMLAVLLSLQRLSGEGAAHQKNQALAEWMAAHLMAIGLRTLLCRPGLSQSAFLDHVLHALSRLIPAAQQQQFTLWTGKLLADNKWLSAETLIPDGHSIGQINPGTGTKPVPGNADRLAAEAHNKEGAGVGNDPVSDGQPLLHSLLKEYVPLLVRERRHIPEHKIAARLRALYWKCIEADTDHRGSSAVLRRSFRTAVFYSFPMAGRSETAEVRAALFAPLNSATCPLKGGRSLSCSELFLLLEQGLLLGTTAMTYKGREIHLSELIRIGLERYPREIRKIMAQVPITEKRIKTLKASVSFPQFSLWIMHDAGGVMLDAMESMRVLYELIRHLASGQMAGGILLKFWEQAWRLIQTNTGAAGALKTLVQDSFHQLAKENPVNSAFILTQIEKAGFRLTPQLRKTLAGYVPAFSALPINSITQAGKTVLKFKHKGLLYELSCHILSQRQLPPCCDPANGQEVKEVLQELVVRHPEQLLLVFRREVISEQQLLWLSRTVDVKALIRAIGDLNRNKQTLLGILEKLYGALETIPASGIAAKEIQYILFMKLVKAWTHDNWKSISTENIWQELLWDLGVQRGISAGRFIQMIEKVKPRLPLALQISFGYLKDQEKRAGAPAGASEVPGLSGPALLRKPAVHTGSIALRNAGLVLLNSYIPLLFKRLGLFDSQSDAYKDATAQSDAVHYLQYVVTGLSSTEEFLLPLNKVLCGLPLSQPVKAGIHLSETHRELIHQMINAVIGYWPAIGDSSVDGFRGNWLVRGGLLMEYDTKWELTVEKRIYDLLIHRSPFSFSIIRYAWMDKPLHVNWPY